MVARESASRPRKILKATMMMMMMMMMCNDLMCTQKLTRSQLSLAHSSKVKTNIPEKNEKQLESVESVWWVER